MRHIIMAPEWFRSFARTRVKITKEQTDRGDAWLSYLAVAAFVLAISVAVLGSSIPQDIVGGIQKQITSIAGLGGTTNPKVGVSLIPSPKKS